MSTDETQEQRVLPEHRVAVTVFATVRAVDGIDAGHIVTRSVRQALIAASTVPQDCVLPLAFRKQTDPVRVCHVMETGMAAGNGYLWTAPTSKAYRESGGFDDE